jgi:predicted metal-binding membrane protein
MSLPPKRFVVETVPVVVILLFWSLLAWVVDFQNVGGPVRTAGFVMAALYVAVRGVALSTRVSPPATLDMASILRENARIAVPAGAWFVAAMAVAMVGPSVPGLPRVFAPVAGTLASGGLGVVGLYAVAAGTTAIRGRTGADRGGDDR